MLNYGCIPITKRQCWWKFKSKAIQFHTFLLSKRAEECLQIILGIIIVIFFFLITIIIFSPGFFLIPRTEAVSLVLREWVTGLFWGWRKYCSNAVLQQCELMGFPLLEPWLTWRILLVFCETAVISQPLSSDRWAVMSLAVNKNDPWLTNRKITFNLRRCN